MSSFDTSARADELVPAEVIVAGKSYTVRRTGKALKAIIGLNPEGDTDDPAKNIEQLYESIAVVLVDEAGKHPSAKILEDELDFEVAQELLEKFVPQRGEGNAEEQSSNGER